MSMLMEQWVQPAQGDGYGRRIATDGTVEEHTSLTASFESGELAYATQRAQWRTVGRAAPEALRELERTVAATDLDVPELPGTTVVKARLVWTIGETRLELTDAHLQLAPALAALDRTFQLVFAHATENPA